MKKKQHRLLNLLYIGLRVLIMRKYNQFAVAILILVSQVLVAQSAQSSFFYNCFYILELKEASVEDDYYTYKTKVLEQKYVGGHADDCVKKGKLITISNTPPLSTNATTLLEVNPALNYKDIKSGGRMMIEFTYSNSKIAGDSNYWRLLNYYDADGTSYPSLQSTITAQKLFTQMLNNLVENPE